MTKQEIFNNVKVTLKGKRTVKNIRWIEKHAELMTNKELQDFINYDYGLDNLKF